jgi:glutamyl-tRNA reductase
MKDMVPDIACIGMSHKTAPVEIRELFTVPEEDLEAFYHKLIECGCEEAVYIGTCNRVEVYFAAKHIESVTEKVSSFLRSFTSLDEDAYRSHSYEYVSHDAVRHLFRVISSLDSMVVGENEIAGQIRAGYKGAVSFEITGTMLNKLFHSAFSTSKKIRTETEISQNPTSIAGIAADVASEMSPDFKQANALLIGAGEMGELILKNLSKKGVGSITLANRTRERAEEIAGDMDREVTIVGIKELEDAALASDIIVSSVTSPHHIITTNMARSIMELREGKPLFIIDIAVPRNVDPGAAFIDGISLFNVDDMEKVAKENMEKRKAATEDAEHLVRVMVEEFFYWYHEQSATPVISGMRKAFDDIRKQELQRYRQSPLKDLTEEQFALVEELTTQIMTKTLHRPILSLKRRHREKVHHKVVDKDLKEKTTFIKELFYDEDA